MDHPLWYMNAVFYEVYVRAYCDSTGDGNGDLRGLVSKLDYIKSLGVDCIWLLPIYPSPLRDDGYDIADYYNVMREYGAVDDIKALIHAVHQRGMYLIADLVLNHTSDMHPWFQEARRERSSPYRDYYVWSDTDQKYTDARIIFLDSETSNWTWDEMAGQYFWHRFYSTQPDLNYDNPKVQQEMENVARFWLDMGIDGFRADAVPYLFEREGTNCENLPETHTYLKQLRTFMDREYPGRILLCEANQWPEDVRPYFGDGDEFHMGFHFPVMPRIYMAIRKAQRDPLVWIINRTPEIPAGCQWCTFLRNHDELTLEMVTGEERQWMWQEFAPQERMRLNLGIRRRLAPLLDNDRRKIELANSLLFTMPGSPIIYYGDEIGMGDNIWLDDRNGVRTPMQWDSSLNGGFSTAEKLYSPVIGSESFNPQKVNVADQDRDAQSLLNTIRRMVAVRKKHPAFSSHSFAWVDAHNEAVAAYTRQEGNELLIVFNNLSGDPQAVTVQLPEGVKSLQDILSGNVIEVAPEGCLERTLQPYDYLWLKS
ncbi:MAG TPA: maltose alpha-D-glucosyltransferase [Levilinea sp.]|nr:maltose alpha-D-glucosyltransferase [Levilinea sp.]